MAGETLKERHKRAMRAHEDACARLEETLTHPGLDYDALRNGEIPAGYPYEERSTSSHREKREWTYQSYGKWSHFGDIKIFKNSDGSYTGKYDGNKGFLHFTEFKKNQWKATYSNSRYDGPSSYGTVVFIRIAQGKYNGHWSSSDNENVGTWNIIEVPNKKPKCKVRRTRTIHQNKKRSNSNQCANVKRKKRRKKRRVRLYPQVNVDPKPAPLEPISIPPGVDTMKYLLMQQEKLINDIESLTSPEPSFRSIIFNNDETHVSDQSVEVDNASDGEESSPTCEQNTPSATTGSKETSDGSEDKDFIAMFKERLAPHVSKCVEISSSVMAESTLQVTSSFNLGINAIAQSVVETREELVKQFNNKIKQVDGKVERAHEQAKDHEVRIKRLEEEMAKRIRDRARRRKEVPVIVIE